MKILDFLGLTELVELCKETFASITHKHTLNDITDYTVDSTFSSTSTNPIQNKVVNNALVTIAEDMDKIDADINKINDEKADKTELPTKVSQLENDSNYATNEDVTTALNTSQSDWSQSDESSADYIKNRTHYEEIVETGEATEVYNGSVTNRIMLNVITYDFGFGEMLYVTFDGVKYKLYGHRSGIICSYTSNEGDIPFYVNHDTLDQVLNFSCKDSGTHMVLIEIPVVKSVVHKLDSKFIPDSVVDKEYLEQELDSSIADWNQSDETATSFIKNKPFGEDIQYSVVVDEKEIECYTVKDNGYYTSIEDEYVHEDFLLGGKGVAFLWDGKIYDVEEGNTSHNGYHYIYYGNAYLMGITDEDNGLPFCVRVIIGDYIEVVGIDVYARTQGNHTIALYAKSSVVKTIDEKYLPDTVKNENIVQLQSDWNQSNEWSDDYIKNRPFYEETIDTGDVETLYEGTYTHAAAFTLPKTIYNDVLYVTFNQENYTLTRHDVNPIEWDYHSTDGTELPFGLYYDGLENKMYFDLFGYEFTTDKVDVLIEAPVIEKNIVQLDEKFIPDTIARSSDLEPLNDKMTYHTDVEDVHMTDERKSQLTNAYTHSTNSNIHLTSEEKAQLLSHKDDVDNPHQILEKIEANSDLVVTELGDEIVGDSPELDPVVESRISEIETEVSSLKSDLADYIVPDYVVSEAKEVADKVIANRTINSLVLLAAADIHVNPTESVRTAIKHMGMGMAETRKYLTPDGVVLFGDYNYGITPQSKEQGIEDMKLAHKFVANAVNGVPSIWMNGNHDYYSVSTSTPELRLSEDMVYSLVGSHNTDKAVVDVDNIGRNYGYVDFEKQRIRLIYLNTTDVSGTDSLSHLISTPQGQWFINVALDFRDKSDEEKWGFIVCSHIPLFDNPQVPKVLGNFVDRTSGENFGKSYSFGNAKAKLIAIFHGHIHNFKVTRKTTSGGNELIYICIPNALPSRENPYTTEDYQEVDDSGNAVSYPKTAGTAEDTSFNIITIDRDNEIIYAHCYGAGYDRTISYSKGVVIYNITTNLTNCSGATTNATTINSTDDNVKLSFTANRGCELPDTITVVGVSNYSWDKSTGELILGRPTRNVVVTLEATLIPTDYTNVLFEVGYTDGARTGSDGAVRTGAPTDLTGFIPCTKGDILRFANCEILNVSGTNYQECAVYRSDKTFIDKVSLSTLTVGITKDDNNNIIALDTGMFASTYDNMAFVRISGNYIGEDSIITVNEEIT